MSEKPTQDDLRRLVDREVHYCVSSLVHTLAQHSYTEKGDLLELMEQTCELSSPIDDWEEALRGEGYQIRHDIDGYYVLTDDEAKHEDAGNNSAGFDGREHYDTIEEAARGGCEEYSVEPYAREVYEHWIVSDWLADKLAARGEKVDKDFAGLTVWARTCTGQAIYLDSIIEDIWRELHKS